jgi:hypothetical protein
MNERWIERGTRGKSLNFSLGEREEEDMESELYMTSRGPLTIFTPTRSDNSLDLYRTSTFITQSSKRLLIYVNVHN